MEVIGIEACEKKMRKEWEEQEDYGHWSCSEP